MWRSYYDREPGRLFLQLGELLRTQYRLPALRSQVTAYHAARAAFVFKDGRTRADYARALPHLERYYAAILRASDTPFDARRAAALELEWWIVHRERAIRGEHASDDLVEALAALQGELYALPPSRLTDHARLRAEAMAVRDTRAEAGGVREADWLRIRELLDGSWRSMRAAAAGRVAG
jgi:hypothetical protein